MIVALPGLFSYLFYPNVSLDVIEALALDHFIDAFTDTKIRLRLREIGPKTLAEA